MGWQNLGTWRTSSQVLFRLHSQDEPGGATTWTTALEVRPGDDIQRLILKSPFPGDTPPPWTIDNG